MCIRDSPSPSSANYIPSIQITQSTPRNIPGSQNSAPQLNPSLAHHHRFQSNPPPHTPPSGSPTTQFQFNHSPTNSPSAASPSASDIDSLKHWIAQSQQDLLLQVQSSVQQQLEHAHPHHQRIPLANDYPGANISSSAPAPSCGESAGRARAVRYKNESVVSVLGITPRTNWEFVGDRNSVDIGRMKKTMTSGENSCDQGTVLSQIHWPHSLVSIASSSKPAKHSKLTFSQFTEGMIGKMLLEADPDRLDPRLKNQMLFFHFLIKISYSLPWNLVLEVAARHFRALEQLHTSWDDWDAIHTALKTAYEQVRMSAFLQKGGNGPAGGGGGPTPAPKGDELCFGIPTRWIRSKNICVKFNFESCQSQADHVVAIGKPPVNTTILHLCAGCFNKGQSTKAHGAKSCPNRPHQSSLFR